MEGGSSAKQDNYTVSIMYDRYYVRKMEISENVLMIAICDTEVDGTTGQEGDEDHYKGSSFNIGQVDLLYEDYIENF